MLDLGISKPHTGSKVRDVLGQTQSGGRTSLRLLRVIQDSKLIQEVRKEIEELFESDPALTKHEVLRYLLEEQHAAANLVKG